MGRKLFIGLEESNLQEFRTPCCNAYVTTEPLMTYKCSECEEVIELKELHHEKEVASGLGDNLASKH